MGCKFSISVDQQKPKTPKWLSSRKSMPVDSIKTQDSTNQTEEGTETPDAETPDAETPDADVVSSPEQIDIKSLKKRRSTASQWKP